MNESKKTKVQLFSGFPLFMREIRVLLRSNKSFLCMLIFLGALLALVALNWTTFTSHWENLEELLIAQGTREFYYSLARGHIYLILILMPFLLAPSIVEEREKSTLDLLISSPISISRLVLTKFISPMLYVFLLLVGAAPVLSLCFLGQGLGPADIAYTYIILLCTAVMYGCLGLFCSTLRPRIYEVYLAATAMTFLLVLFVPYHGSVWNYLSQMKWEIGRGINHGFEYLSPFYILENIFYATSRASRESILFIYIVSSVTVSGVLLIAAMGMVHRIASGAAAARGYESEDDEDSTDLRVRDYSITFRETSQDGNPGLTLERRVQWFARLPVLLRLFYSALLLSVLTLPMASYQGSWLFLSMPFVSAAFFTLPLAATSISSDYERETMYLLRTSLLSSKQIVYAKFIASLQYSFLIALALYLPGMTIQLMCSVLGFEVDLATNLTDSLAMVFYPIVLFFSLLMYTAWGLFCSTLFRRSNKALIVAGLIILATISAPFLIPNIHFFALSNLFYYVTFVLMFLSPLAGIIILFPTGAIKYLERSLFAADSAAILPYAFCVCQCVFFCLITYYLLNRAVRTLENHD